MFCDSHLPGTLRLPHQLLAPHIFHEHDLTIFSSPSIERTPKAPPTSPTQPLSRHLPGRVDQVLGELLASDTRRSSGKVSIFTGLAFRTATHV